MVDPDNEPHAMDRDAAKLAVMGHLSLAIDVLLIAGCLYLLTSDIAQAASGTPEFAPRGGAFLVNLSATFALLHRGMALLKRFRSAPRAQRPAGLNLWLIAVMLVLPLSVASGVEVLVHHGYRAQLDALVERISKTTADALGRGGVVRAAHLRVLHGPYLQQLTVRTDNGTFLLTAKVPSLGADGFTAHYSSTQRSWHLQSAGSPPPRTLEFDAVGPTLACRLAGAKLECEENES